MPSENEISVLEKEGWQLVNSQWHSCRVCHRRIHDKAWQKGKVYYHPGCILKSKQVQRLLKKASELSSRMNGQ